MLALQPLWFFGGFLSQICLPPAVCAPLCVPGSAGTGILQDALGRARHPRVVLFSPGCAAPAGFAQEGDWQGWELATIPSRNWFVGSPGSLSIWDASVHKRGKSLSGNCGLDYSKIPE